MNTPRISYACDIVDVSALPGLLEQQVKLGDVVDVYDDGIDFHVKTRIVRVKYNVSEPWGSQLELANNMLDLSSTVSMLQRQAGRLDEWVPLPMPPWEPEIFVADSITLSHWSLSIADELSVLRPEDVSSIIADSTTLPIMGATDVATVTLT